MSAQPSQADWGRTAETAACERFGLEHVAGDHDAPGPWWHDAITTEWVGDVESAFGAVAPGTPVEVKAARFRIDNNGSRRGRWWLAERSHERLLAESGEYALAVYRPGDGVLALSLRPAWWADALVTRWSPCGTGHQIERSAQIPWGRAFESSEVVA